MRPGIANNAMVQMGVDPGLVAMLDESRAAHRTLSRASMGELDNINTQRQDIIGRPLTRPEVPDLPETPEAPKMSVPGNGARVYAQFLPVLAMLGGALVKRDATAALRTGAAAMRAARANDVQNLELQHQHWEDQVERVVSEREATLAEYQAALTDTNLDLTQRMALLNALTARENNIELRTRLAMGDIAGITESINTQVRAVESIRNQQREDRSLNERERHNRAMEVRQTARGGTFPSEQRARVAVTYNSALEASNLLQSMENDGYRINQDWGATATDALDMGTGVADSWARAAGGEDYNQYESARRSFEAAVLPILSGAAVTPTESRRLIRSVIPSAGDTDAVLADKARRRRQMLNGAATIGGITPPFPNDGVPVWATLPNQESGADVAVTGDIPNAAVDYLRNNPDTAAQFEEQFGLEPGAAAEYLE